MDVTILGHAGLLVEAADTRVLVDPVLGDRLASGAICFHPGRRIDREGMPVPTHLVLSHGHLDHFDPPSLAGVPRDVEVVIPKDPWLRERVRALGFTSLVELGPWERHATGAVTLLATASAFEIDEIGVVFSADGATFWHGGDSILVPEDGRRVLAEVGPVTASSAKYQSGRILVSHQRNLGSAVVDRTEIVDALEAVCAAEPTFVFPYAWGVAYADRHAWANRYSAPYDAEEIVRLLRRRLGSDARVDILLPGDVLELHDGGARPRAQSSPFVRHEAVAVDRWEPLETDQLPGPGDPARRDELVQRLEHHLVATFGPWLQPLVDTPGAPLRRLVDWGVVWQLVVHVDGGRLHYSIDFRSPEVRLRRVLHPDANYFVHLGGADVLRVLRGDAGAELFWLCGGCRTYEKILFLQDGRITAPPVSGWQLYEQLPEPLTLCLRKVGVEERTPSPSAPPATEGAERGADPGAGPSTPDGRRMRLGRHVDVRVVYDDRTPFGSPVSARADEGTRRLFRPLLDRLDAEGPAAMASWAPVAVDELRRSEGFAAVAVPDGDAWALRPEVLHPDPALAPPVALEFLAPDDGRMLRVDVPPGGWPVMRTALGALGRDGLDVHAPDTSPVAQLVSHLLAEGLLGSVDTASAELPVGCTFVGHNTVLCRSATTTVLTDPFFLAQRSHHPPGYRPMGPADLGRVDAVLLTHAHPDHFDPGSLLRLPSDATIVVPRIERESVLTVDMARRIRELGHEHVVELAWGERTRVGDIDIAALPFHGEQPGSGAVLHPDVRNVGNTYVLRSPAWSAAFLADAGRDHAGDVRQDMAAAGAALGPVDVVFAGYRGWATYPSQLLFSSVARYCLFLAPVEWGRRQQLMNDAADAVDAAERIGARLLVPYADGGAPWYWEVGLGHRADGTGREDRTFDPLPERLAAVAARRLVAPDGTSVRSPVDVVVLRPGESLVDLQGRARCARHDGHRWPYPATPVTEA